MIEIGLTLKKCRELRHMTLGQLSISSGLDKSYLSKIENDKRDPSIKYLQQVCIALDIPLGMFIFLAEDSTNEEFSSLTNTMKDLAWRHLESE